MGGELARGAVEEVAVGVFEAVGEGALRVSSVLVPYGKETGWNSGVGFVMEAD